MSSANTSALCTRLRFLIGEQGTTVTALAKELGVSRQAVSMYLEGKSFPNSEKLSALANWFGVTTDWLLGRSDVRTEQDYQKYRDAVERMGSFGKLFLDYEGCPRGPEGRSCGSLVREVISMGVIKDVDGGEWVPVNKDALVELVGRYNLLVGMVGKDPFAKAYEEEDNE